jgi:hypothetical protein
MSRSESNTCVVVMLSSISQRRSAAEFSADYRREATGLLPATTFRPAPKRRQKIRG